MLSKKPAIVAALFTTLILAAGTYYSWAAQTNTVDSPEKESTPVKQFPNEVVNNVSLAKEKAGAKVDPASLDQGCFLGKDCIRSIDNPKFIAAEEADEWLNPQDVVFAVNHNDVIKVYPQKILNWHEIVNDKFVDDPVAVTFCPLCGTAVSYIRKVDEVITQFGVSGKLYNSDLIMYDRYEGNLWQHATGEAIVGKAAQRNEVLEKIPTITTTWERWKEKYSDSLVLSKDTGYNRNYDQYPYGTYESDGDIYFGLENTDTRLHPKEVVYGVKVDDVPKAYREVRLKTEKSFDDKIGEVTVQVDYLPTGEITIMNVETGETYEYLRSFWFAWAAFNPDTDIF